ncbi:unnamed protein product, partial [marine sediment metagenome]
NPIMYIEDVFEDCLYGDTPAGRDTIGTKKNILGFSRKDFLDYLSAQYGTHNSFVCLVGNLGGKTEKQSFVGTQNFVSVQKYFSSDKFAHRGLNFKEKDAVRENQAKPQVKIHYKKTDQVHLSLGVRTFGYNHKDKLIAKLLSIILGGSMSSRLFINLRERHGLAYYVRTEVETYSDSGYLATRAGVPVNKAALAIKIILAEYKKLKKGQVLARELKRIKDLLAGRLAIQLEASDNLASWYGRQALLFNTIKRESGSQQFSLRKILTPES